jgi:hypothetical protein
MADDKWGKPCHIYAVRCPHCLKPQDFREVGDAVTEGSGKARPTVECDHCGGVIEVVKVEVATLVWVRKWSGKVAATQRKSFTVWKCEKCGGEHYGDKPPLIDRQKRPRCAILTTERTADGLQKPCAGILTRQVVTDDVGERHHVLESSRLVFRCPACSAEFYDRGYTINEAGQHICTCGEPLVQQA